MKKLLPAGLLALLASAVILHGAVEASPQKGGKLSFSGKTLPKTTVSPTIIPKTTVSPTIIPKTGPVINTGKTQVLNLGKKGTGMVTNSAKKGGPTLNILGQGSPSPIGVNGKSLVKSDLYCKPYGKNHCGWWGGWCGGGWGGGYGPCYQPCGWFGGWCNPVIMEPMIIDSPFPGPGGFGGPGPGINPDPGPGPGPGPGADPVKDTADLKKQTKRFLKVKNESGEKLQVFVQYIVKTEDGESMWCPGEAGSDKALAMTLEAGQELFVENKGKKIATNMVRIWAVSEKGKFMEFRGTDLRIVPEQDQGGEYMYMAPETKTFTFVFPPLSEITEPGPVTPTPGPVGTTPGPVATTDVAPVRPPTVIRND